MAVNVIKRTWLQDRMVRPETLNGMAFQAEAGAHRFEITGYDSNGNKMAFSGNVTATFLRPDNTDVPLTGVISNGVAQVTLSQECYQVPGRFGLAIFVNSGNTKTVVYKCIGPVGMTSSGVAASSVVQSVSTLIDRIEAAVNSIPQDYSALNKAVSATCPEMRNGSTGNPGNANSITTKYIIKIDKSCDELILEYIGNTQAKYYIFGYSVFKGVADGTKSIVARTTAASFLDYPEKYVQTEPYVIIPVSQFGDYTHIAFVLWAKSDETTNIPLRIATDQNNLRVNFRHASSMGHEEINNRSVKVGVQNASKTASPLKLVHFSDLHRDVNALNRIRASVKYVCPNADNVICTGDIVADTYAEITSWWIPEFMTCIGNHDTASYNGSYNWTALTMAQRDEMYISPFESYWGIVHTAGTSYYYKDYPTAHIRLIVMDAMLYSGTPGAEATAQTEWLANLLASAITGSLHVIIAIHAPHGGAVPVACSFTKLGQGNMYINVDCNTPDVVINTVATAIGNGLHFIGYICGHTHQDVIWDCTGDRSQLMYNVTCAAVDQTAQWENSDQYRSEELDAFNVLTIDTASTTIKILRGGGANIDVALRPRVSMVINYSTGKIITDTYASGTQDAVVYGEAQELTDAQKAQARANIGAGSAADVSENTADITANANEITSLKSALETNIDGTYQVLTQGSYNVPDVGSVMSTDKSTLATYASAIVPCVAGDIFTAKLYGGGSVSAGGARAYAFLNASYEVLYRYVQNTVFNGTVTAPENAAYFVANTKNESPDYYVLKGKLIAAQIGELKNDLSETKNDVAVSRINALELKYYDIGSGFNLIDKETTVKGYINPNGVIIPADSGYHVTDYIPVKGNDVVSNSIASSNILPYAVYDSTFTFLRTVNTTQYTYISGDAYIRITIRDAQYEEARAFYGTVLNSYKPFIVPEKISPVDVVVGPLDWCDYANVDDALNGITDDSPTKQYTIRVLAGVYPTFSMRHSDPERTVKVNNARWINIIGDDPYTVKFFDNRGNRDLSPCNIFTNGRIENITFQVEADADHYSPTETQTSCYAVHQDYNTCNTQYINCRFLSNVGPAFGAGLFQNSHYDLINCYFESTCDGSFGAGAQTGQGAIFVHTYASLYKAVNQNLKIVDSIAVATAQPNGGRFAVIGSTQTGYGSTYDFNFQNFGCFGQNGAQVNLQDPDHDLLGKYNFGNLPASLNTVS